MLIKRRQHNILPPHMREWAFKKLYTYQRRRLMHQGIKASRLRNHALESLISLQILETLSDKMAQMIWHENRR